MSVLRKFEPRARYQKPMAMHVGKGKAHHALPVINSETRFCVGHGAAGYSNPIAPGAVLVGETAISKSAVM
jgi:hypothetical protein